MSSTFNTNSVASLIHPLQKENDFKEWDTSLQWALQSVKLLSVLTKQHQDDYVKLQNTYSLFISSNTSLSFAYSLPSPSSASSTSSSSSSSSSSTTSTVSNATDIKQSDATKDDASSKPTEKSPSPSITDVYEKQSSKVATVIIILISSVKDKTMRDLISPLKHPFAMYTILSDKYKSKDQSHSARTYLSQLLSMKQGQNESFASFCSRLDTTCNMLSSLNNPVNDDMKLTVLRNAVVNEKHAELVSLALFQEKDYTKVVDKVTEQLIQVSIPNPQIVEPSASSLASYQAQLNNENKSRSSSSERDSSSSTSSSAPERRHNNNHFREFNSNKKNHHHIKNSNRRPNPYYSNYSNSFNSSNSSNSSNFNRNNKSNFRSQKKCFNCGLSNHPITDCHKPCTYHPNVKRRDCKSTHNREDNPKNAKSNTEHSHFTEFCSFSTLQALYVATTKLTDEFVVDTGATSNFINNLKFYDQTSLRTVEGCPIQVADGNTFYATQIGTATLEALNSNNEKHTIKLLNCYYVPTFKVNLISASKLKESRLRADLRGQQIYIYNSDGIQVLSTILARPYVVSTPTSSFQLAHLSSIDSNHTTELDKLKSIHYRYGHPNIHVLKKIIAEQKLPISATFLSSVKSLNCDDCLLCKAVRTPFKSSSGHSSASAPLQLLHYDLFGPITPATSEGYRYCLVIIDDYSRFCITSFMSNKSDAANHLQEFILSNSQFNIKSIKRMRSDNDAVFTSNKFVSFLKTNRISQELTVPYSPSSNGVAERAIRTLKDTARTLLNQSGLEYEYWNFAIRHAAYVKNRTTHKTKHKAPLLLFNNYSLINYKEMHSFGCLTFAKILPVPASKLAPRAIKCVFLGYADNRKAYLVMDLQTMEKFASRDCHFIEDTFPLKNSPSVSKSPTTTTKLLFEDELLLPISTSDNSWRELPSDDFEDDSAADFKHIPTTNPSSAHIPTPSPAPLTISSTASLMSSSTTASVLSSTVSSTTSSSSSSSTTTVPIRHNPRPSRGYVPTAKALEHVAMKDEIKQILAPVNKTSTSSALTASTTLSSSDITNINDDNLTYSQALSSPQSVKWKDAIKSELKSIAENKTWIEVPAAESTKNNKNPISTRWIFKVKTESDNSLRYKARLVARGFEQIYGEDFTDTYAPTLGMSSLRLLLAYAAANCLEVHHLDVKTAFLHSKIDELIYLQPPEGFTVATAGNILQLKKSLYGLKQAPHLWNKELKNYLTSIGFKPLIADTCIFVSANQQLILSFYVDDILLFSAHQPTINVTKSVLKDKFNITDLGHVKRYLGIDISITETNIKLTQTKLIKQLLGECNLTECKSAPIPNLEKYSDKYSTIFGDTSSSTENTTRYRSILGKLIYLANTRPDLSNAVMIAARNGTYPTSQDWLRLQQILCYLKGTISDGLTYVCGKSINLCAFADASHLSIDHTHSVSGYTIMASGASVFWSSKKQKTVANSTCEAELVAASVCLQQLIYINNFLNELPVFNSDSATSLPIPFYCDNESLVSAVTNPSSSSIQRLRYVKPKLAFITEHIESKFIKFNWISGKKNPADILTKPLDYQKHSTYSRTLLGASSSTTL